MISAKTPYLYICRRQSALWCRSCGSSADGGRRVRGLCRPCYERERRNRVHFAGLRPRVLARDRNTCQVCGRAGAGKHLPVHHRRSGNSKIQLLITLCPGCHAVVHRTRFWRAQEAPLAAALWREQHPGAPEQLALPFDRVPVLGHIEARPLWEVSSG